MRLLSRLLIVLVVCIAAIALPTVPTLAAGPWIELYPDNGVPGMNVTIEGHNFTAGQDLDVYYYRDAANTTRVRVLQVEADGDGDFEETFIVPESYTGVHEVRAYVGTNTSVAENFTAEPGLTVSPRKGPVSTNVTVEGHGFAKNEASIELRYYLDGNYTTIARNITANEYGWWKKSFVIPASSRGNHKIDAEGAESSFAEVNDATFEVTPGISLGKPSGSPGDDVTMTGSGFAASERDITILFGGEAVKTQIRADTTGYWQESFLVPEKPKGTYNVTSYGESTLKGTVSAVNFNIMSSLLLSPSEGHVGTNLTAAGRGFAANKDVDVTYDGSQVTGRTDSKGSFNITFAVPESRHGTRQVTASDTAGNNAAAVFTMESDAPDKPETVSPPDESRVGFIGKVTPTFQWSEVSDESGVRYSLQLAASANVTAAGAFAHPIISVTDLVGTNYTLDATQALPYGTYYWIVQAIDRAENESGWTAAHSFRAGLLPLWAFILGIVVAVAVIGSLVYFLAVRRRVHYY